MVIFVLNIRKRVSNQIFSTCGSYLKSVGDPVWLINEAATDIAGRIINKTSEFKTHAGGTFCHRSEYT